jgi:DNA-binding transcriptional LysR family regulator
VDFERQGRRHLSVELIIANSAMVRDLVREGRAEFGIAATDPTAPPETSARELFFCDDEVVVAVPAGHAWAEMDEVAVEDLVATPMIMRDPSANTRRVVEAALETHGLALAPPLAEVGSTSAAKATAVSEGAPVLLSRLAVRPDGESLVARSVAGIDLSRRFVLVLGAEEALSPSALALLDHLLEVARQPITAG